MLKISGVHQEWHEEIKHLVIRMVGEHGNDLDIGTGDLSSIAAQASVELLDNRASIALDESLLVDKAAFFNALAVELARVLMHKVGGDDE